MTPRTNGPDIFGSPNQSDSATHGAAVPAPWETLLTSDLKRPRLHRSGSLVPSMHAMFVGSSARLRAHPVVPERRMQTLSGVGTSPRQSRLPHPVRQMSSACNAGGLTPQAVKAQLCDPASGPSLRSILKVSASCPTAQAAAGPFRHTHMLVASQDGNVWLVPRQGVQTNLPICSLFLGRHHVVSGGRANDPKLACVCLRPD